MGKQTDVTARFGSVQKACQVGAALTMAACSAAVPNEPSWSDDVRPILLANCVRCHSPNTRGGAPHSFRLDVYDSSITDDGRLVLGAGSMAEFIAARTGAGTMPPRFPLRGNHKEVLHNWFEDADPGATAPLGEARASNEAPTMTVLEGFEDTETAGQLAIVYQIDDGDGDSVTGSLIAVGAERHLITSELHSGRGTARWDVGATPEGTYTLTAELNDGLSTTEVQLAPYTVVHPNNNTAPSLFFDRPLRNQLFADVDSPVILTIVFHDPEADPLDINVVASLGDNEVVVAELRGVASGRHDFALDTAALDAGVLWRVTATVSDGQSERQLVSGPFVVAHGTTELRYTDVAPIFASYCAPCHPGGGTLARIPGLSFDARDYDDSGVGVYAHRGAIFRRVVHERSMPPRSAQLVVDESLILSERERQQLSEWLSAGAPR